MASLGNWALIDIETTGIDSSYDEIIDIGFLEFNGLELVRKYSSLVRSEVAVSPFIEKLTGINQKQVNKAPLWSKVVQDVYDLSSFQLIAHNSDFEASFLDREFAQLEERPTYHDSLLFLGLLFPNSHSLKLEHFIVKFGIAEEEVHRGLEDSISLLQVLLVGCSLIKQDAELDSFIQGQLKDIGDDFFFGKFFSLEMSELYQIAEQIDFNLSDILSRQMSGPEKEWVRLEKTDLSFTAANLEKILKDQSRASQALPGYKTRPAQIQMAKKIGQSFANSIHAIVQAPTGTGKSMGYLLPSILYNLKTKNQVLISTGTKTLQNQAMDKDVPATLQLLGLSEDEFKVVRIVGSQNHFCELLFRNRKVEGLVAAMGELSDKFKEAYFERVFYYNRRVTSYRDIMTRADIPYVLKKKVTGLIEREEQSAADFRSCTGHKCPFKNSCTYFNGAKEAKEANIIIGNHSLLLRWPRSIERPGYIVVDEAHKLEAEATSAFSLEVKQKDIEGFSKNLSQLLGPFMYLVNQLDYSESTISRVRSNILEAGSMLQDHLPGLQESIERLAKQLPRFTDLYWNELKLSDASPSNNIEAAIRNHLLSLHSIFKNMLEELAPFQSRIEDIDPNDENLAIAKTSYDTFYTSIEDYHATIESSLDIDALKANTIGYHEDFGYLINSSPVDVGKKLFLEVVEAAESVVFTSATLGNQDGSVGMAAVEWMTGYKYLDPSRRFKKGLFLDNNFDYQTSARTFLVTDMPPMYDQSFIPETLSKLQALIRQIEGKSLLLFSSKVRFEAASNLLLDEFEGELPLFIQGMGNDIVTSFKQSSNGVLIGMESLGEGIDIPGEALELVYIDKIPDVRREYVIDKRRDFYEREFGNEFVDYFLASRTRSLHQKFGRLLRRDSDYGAIIVTDSRLAKWKGRTMDSFKNLMRPYQVNITSMEQACREARDFIFSRRK